jgi:hypothetical protein
MVRLTGLKTVVKYCGTVVVNRKAERGRWASDTTNLGEEK